MLSDADRNCLRTALELAREGRGLTSPNPMVGAVVVDRHGQECGRGFHTYENASHAEAVALARAGDKAKGGTLYVSLEPCSHQGRTPPCADAAIQAGVARVIAPIEDANPAVAGTGFQKLREAGITVEIAEDFAVEATKLNEPFLHHAKTGRPLVTLKTAVTLDGKIAAPDDNTGWITSDQARQHVQQVRHDHDAVLAGIGSVLEDDPLYTDRSGLPRRRPLMRIVADSLCRLPLSSRLVESFDDDLVVVSTSAAIEKQRKQLEARGIPVLILDGERGRVDLKRLVEWVGEQKMISLMIEAGAKLNWAALDEEIVDKVLIYYAPKILGGMESLPLAGGAGRRSRAGAIKLHTLTTHHIGPDEFTVEAYL